MPHATDRCRYFHIAGGLLTSSTRLQRPSHYRLMLKNLAAQLETHRIGLLAFCLLPNSWHLVVGTRRTSGLNALVTGVRNTHRERPGSAVDPMPVAITPLDTGAALLGRCVMVERRPVATGLVRQVQDWPWGSAAERFRLQARVPLVSPRALLSQTWFDHLNAPRPGDAHSAIGRHDLAQSPGRFATGPQVLDETIDVSCRAHEDHADAHVERSKHLRIRHTAETLKPGEHRRNGPAPTVE